MTESLPLCRPRRTIRRTQEGGADCTNTWLLLCDVDHRQDEEWCAITYFFPEVRMFDSENDRKRELECLRLASDLTQLATETLNPDLKAHCLRMAGRLSDQAEQGPIGNIPHARIKAGRKPAHTPRMPNSRITRCG